MPSHKDAPGHVQPTDFDDPPVLTWSIDCAEVDRAPTQAGLTRTFQATPDELDALDSAVDPTTCSELRATVTVHARAGSRYLVDGEFEADIEQTCVVTLEPVTSHLRERFSAEFCPAESLPEIADTHFDPDSEDEPMPIVDGRLEIGRLIYENLVLAIDPFPRAAGVEEVNLERGPAEPTRAGAPTADRQSNPFAALAKLKTGKTD